MKIDGRLFQIAYKKLKSSLYYDKTQSIVRDRLVDFEMQHGNMNTYLEQMAQKFLHEETRNELIEEVLASISFYAFPKKLSDEDNSMIKNYSSEKIQISENQYFLDMDIRGHILGVVWLLLIGFQIDDKIYVHSYGNRIRKNLYNELSDKPTFSPYLFEPYFQQYESWRDTALKEARQHLNANQDVVILTLDFKRFYYSVDISEKFMDGIYEVCNINVEEEDDQYKALHDFIYKVIKQYSTLFSEYQGRNILPIGFLPSNVLANYALNNFDKAILNGWNPIYYGRYVDDVIIVDKLEANSDLYLRAKKDQMEAEDIITYFLKQCSGWNGLDGIQCKKQMYSLLYEEEEENEKEEKEKSYVLNKRYNPVSGDKSHIVIQNDKLKIFYFKSGESDALLTCFSETISKNKSEFRYMPEDEAVFQKDDFSEIYDLNNQETINKFRGIQGITIDKFALSKMLGKYLRIGGLIEDRAEDGFDTQIHKIMNPRTIIENYTSWEKVIEILAINESWDSLLQFIKNIRDAINELIYEKDDEILQRVKKSMFDYLYASLGRAMALVWGDNVTEALNKLHKEIYSKDNQTQLIMQHFMEAKRKAYCKTRMIDKTIMPVFIDMIELERVFETHENVNFAKFFPLITYCKKQWEDGYKYYPYLVTMYDFSMITCVEQFLHEGKKFNDSKKLHTSQMTKYVQGNYALDEGVGDEIRKMVTVTDISTYFTDSGRTSYLVSIDNEKKQKLKLAIANVRLSHDNFEKVVMGQENRGYQRYKAVSRIINAAINEHADMLIMPEAYMPFEWLPTIARTCARNNIAIITGVEHVKVDGSIYNLTAVILPYEDLWNTSAYISFHLKTHYAPSEKQKINSYRLKEEVGTHYELYKWHDCYFPVYCCYELTAIMDRALFQSYADFLVAIEWNRDTNYYSNILESLSRDIHCYCVQVNSSDYGDSRITKPSRTEEKDIIRTKGGENSTILTGEIDVTQMRKFQIKGYELQKDDKRFKPTPPGFDEEVVYKKIKGEALFEDE